MFRNYLIISIFLVLSQVFSQTIGELRKSDKELIREGVTLHDEEKYEEAIKLYQQVYPGDSLYDLAQYEITFSLSKLKKYSEAIAICKALLETKTIYKQEILISMGSSFHDMKAYDSAIVVYKKGINLYPNSPRFYNELATTYTAKKDYKAAYESLTKSLKINPFHAKTHVLVGLMAANSKQPTLALMAYQTLCLIQSNPKAVIGTVGFMEELANNNYVPSEENAVDPAFWPKGNPFEETDALIHSKVALTPKYKAKLKLDYNIVKQMQILCEHLPKNVPKEDYISSFYTDFYTNVWDKGMFNGMVLSGLERIEVDKIKKSVSKYAVEILQFKRWGNSYLTDNSEKAVFNFNGKEYTLSKWIDNGIQAIGNLENNVKEGPWQFYHSNGEIQAVGMYKNDSKDGKWRYFTKTGTLEAQETYENGKLNSNYTSYYNNGQINESLPYSNGELNGKAELYYRNGSLRQTIEFSKGKANGKREYYNTVNCRNTMFIENNGIADGEYKEYYESGKVEAEGQQKNDKLYGELKSYFENGKPKSLGSYEEGLRSGLWQWYYENGKVSEKGNYKKGKKEGVWESFYEDGVKYSKEEYKSDLANGVFEYFDTDGIKFSTYEYKNDKLTAFTYFKKNGQVIVSDKLKGGKLHIVKYNPYGEKVSEGDIVDKKEIGEWKLYYTNGNLQYKITYDKGIKSGLQEEYYKNGKLKQQENFTDGKASGYYKRYYINGKLESEGYFVDDEKDGEWKYYRASGSIATREYSNHGATNGPLIEYTHDGKKEFETIYYYNNMDEIKQFDPKTGQMYNSVVFDKGSSNKPLKHANGKTQKEATYKYTKATGLVKWYYSTGKSSSSINYKYGKRNGPYTSYSIDGVKISEGVYKNDEKDSLWKYYDRDGVLSYTANYKNGNLNGIYKTFYPNGKVETERTYINDKVHGETKFYNPDGTIRLVINYQYDDIKSYTYPDASGKLVPIVNVLNETFDININHPNGGTAEKLTYKFGYREGKRTIYNTNGKIIFEANYLNHDYHGEFKEFYPDGTKRIESNYNFDELDGVLRYYYPSGKIRFEETYVNGSLHGPATYYDEQGKVTKKITYEYE